MTARAIMIEEMALATAGARSVQAAELVDGDADLLRAIARRSTGCHGAISIALMAWPCA